MIVTDSSRATTVYTEIIFVKNTGYLFSLNHARLVVLLATVYSIYCVNLRVGWIGVFVSVNLAFLSNDMFSYLLQWCDNLRASTPSEDQKESESFTEADFSGDGEYSTPKDEGEKVNSYKSSVETTVTSSFVNKQNESSTKRVVCEEANSSNEMKRILSSKDHYEVLGFFRHKTTDAILLKKEYRKKVCCF